MSIFWTDVLVCKHPLLPLSWACWILVIYLFFSPLHSCFVVSFRPFLSLTVPVLSRLHQMSGILKETVWTSRTVSRAGNLTSWEAALLGLEANSHGLLHPDLITVLIPVMLLQAGCDATTVSATAVNCSRSLIPLVLNGPYLMSFLKTVKWGCRGQLFTLPTGDWWSRVSFSSFLSQSML